MERVSFLLSAAFAMAILDLILRVYLASFITLPKYLFSFVHYYHRHQMQINYLNCPLLLYLYGISPPVKFGREVGLSPVRVLKNCE